MFKNLFAKHHSYRIILKSGAHVDVLRCKSLTTTEKDNALMSYNFEFYKYETHPVRYVRIDDISAIIRI